MLVCLKPMCYGVSALEAACMQNRGLAQNVSMSFGEPEKNRSEEVRNYNPTPFTSKQHHHPTISYQLISTTSSTSSCLVLQPMFWALKNHIWCIKLYKFTPSTGQPGQLVTASMAFFLGGAGGCRRLSLFSRALGEGLKGDASWNCLRFTNLNCWAIWGWFPLLTMIPVRENSEVVIIYPDPYHATGTRWN